MKSSKFRKCSHCKELYVPDRRNRYHQRFCSKVICRKRSKALSQQRWQQKVPNENYFRGPDNSERVQKWRRSHPGYWRKKKYEPEEVTQPLQDLCNAQAPPGEAVMASVISTALQDVCMMQPALLVGLISTMTGSALQEDIATAARLLLRKGQDILGGDPRSPNPP